MMALLVLGPAHSDRNTFQDSIQMLVVECLQTEGSMVSCSGGEALHNQVCRVLGVMLDEDLLR